LPCDTSDPRQKIFCKTLKKIRAPLLVPTTQAWAHHAWDADPAPAFAYGRRRGRRRRRRVGPRWPTTWRGAARADCHARMPGRAGHRRSRARALVIVSLSCRRGVGPRWPTVWRGAARADLRARMPRALRPVERRPLLELSSRPRHRLPVRPATAAAGEWVRGGRRRGEGRLALTATRAYLGRAGRWSAGHRRCRARALVVVSLSGLPPARARMPGCAGHRCRADPCRPELSLPPCAPVAAFPPASCAGRPRRL